MSNNITTHIYLFIKEQIIKMHNLEACSSMQWRLPDYTVQCTTSNKKHYAVCKLQANVDTNSEDCK